MKKSIALFLFIFLNIQLHAEITQGKVLDANTHLPIVRASVYINGSSIGTSCNDEGVFFLNGFPKPPYKIHLSAVGYETRIVEIPKVSDLNTITILLKPKTLHLTEVVIQSPEKNGWKLYGKEFIEEFIGYSDFAAKCKILNPEALSFIYDKQNFTLRVYAEKPLVIENRALGYKITYWLNDFRRYDQTKAIFFSGASQFEDLITEKTAKRKARRWRENRHSAYQGSIYHFMASLYRNRTKEEGFEVRPLKRVTEEKAFEHAQKTHDTLLFNKQNLDSLELFFKQKLTLSLFQGIYYGDTQSITNRYMSNLKNWYYDTTDSTTISYRFLNPRFYSQGSYLSKLNIVEFRKNRSDPAQIIRSEYVFDTSQIIDKNQVIQSRNFQKGRYDLLYGVLNPDTLIRASFDDYKTVAFENYLQIVYLNEIEEKAYRNRVSWGKSFQKFPQTSVVSLLEIDEIQVYPNGHFEPPYGILLESYWSYEKLDKLLPLDYHAEMHD